MLAKKIQIILDIEVIAGTEIDLENTIKVYSKNLQEEYTTLGKKYGFYGKVNILNVKNKE